MALQMTCPFCKEEFPYDNGALDYKISTKGQRIAEINKRLSDIRLFRKWDDATRHERKLLVSEKDKLSIEIAELKAVRKACDQQIKRFEYQAFKNIVKERHGEAEYKKILAMVDEELQAYKISGLMAHEYTRSNAKSNVTSINKL